MPITKPKGDMYEGFIDYCWSPLAGGCQHQCSFCYAAKNQIRYGQWWKDKPHWSSENFKRVDKMTDPIWKGLPKLPDGKIFVCHTTDMFADNVPKDWIETILEHCWETSVCNGESEFTSFVFQTKNPKRLKEFSHIFERFPKESLTFGITLETNKDTSKYSKAPAPIDRRIAFRDFIRTTQYPSFITIEPVMDFNLIFTKWFEWFTPNLIWIGADSKNCNLPEPSPEKIQGFIEDLRSFTEVRLKPNLDRLLKAVDKNV